MKNPYKAIKRRIDPNPKARIKRLLRNPPEVEQDRILFVSSDDFSGNPKALFLYMVEHGYADKYKITWLFEKREHLIDFGMDNVESICMFDKNGVRTLKAQRAALKSKYLFYSHNVNWVKLFRDDQVFVDLWHGCGYKRDLKTDKTKVEYDYMIVIGDIYKDRFKEMMHNDEGEVLDLGYPRNEMFFSARSAAKEYLDRLKKGAGAQRSVIWMPTFRRSHVKRLDMDIETGQLGLPIVYDQAAMSRLDRICRDNDILLIIKRHHLQIDYDAEEAGLTNTVLISNDDLRSEEADLYEFIGSTDALISDYSSVAIDYMLVGKPLAYTLDDFHEYEEARGWDLDNVKSYMPGDHIYDMDDLESFITDIGKGEDRHSEARNRVRDELHTYRDGFSQRIIDYFEL